MLFSWHCMYLGHEREIQPGGQQQHNHSFTKKQTITPISILSQKAANEIGALWATPPFTIQHYNQPCGFLFQMYMWNFHGRYMSTFFIVHTIKCGILFYITKKKIIIHAGSQCLHQFAIYPTHHGKHHTRHLSHEQHPQVQNVEEPAQNLELLGEENDIMTYMALYWYLFVASGLLKDLIHLKIICRFFFQRYHRDSPQNSFLYQSQSSVNLPKDKFQLCK